MRRPRGRAAPASQTGQCGPQSDRCSPKSRARRPRPGRQALGRIEPAPGISQALCGFPARRGAAPAGQPAHHALRRGSRTPSGGLLPAAGPAGPSWLTNPSSSAQLPSPCEKKREWPDCAPARLGLPSPRCSPRRRTPEKTNKNKPKNLTKKIRNSSTHPRNSAGLFWVKHLDFPGRTRQSASPACLLDPGLARTRLRQKGGLRSQEVICLPDPHPHPWSSTAKKEKEKKKKSCSPGSDLQNHN